MLNKFKNLDPNAKSFIVAVSAIVTANVALRVIAIAIKN